MGRVLLPLGYYLHYLRYSPARDHGDRWSYALRHRISRVNQLSHVLSRGRVVNSKVVSDKVRYSRGLANQNQRVHLGSKPRLCEFNRYFAELGDSSPAWPYLQNSGFVKGMLA